ncbi:MAG: cyclase family protein [Bacteroidales bacterium]|nr:cyclase family protein [Bacteroidales bacterium]
MKPFDIIDLSHSLSSTISVYPGSEKPVTNVVAVLELNGYREKQLSLSSHHGTHIDCPFHMIHDGFHTSNASLNRFFGRGMVLDCRHFVTFHSITTDFLILQKKEIASVDFLLLNTGMDKHWNTPLYTGEFPTITQEAADYLTQFSLKGLGMDTLSVDPLGDTALPVHKTLLSRNIIIIENLRGLEQLIGKKFWFSCFPLKIEEGDGSPVRACALSVFFNFTEKDSH